MDAVHALPARVRARASLSAADVRLSLVPASVGRQVAAWSIDAAAAIIAAIVLAGVFVVIGVWGWMLGVIAAVGAIAAIVVTLRAVATRGSTLGHSLVGIRTVSSVDGMPTASIAHATAYDLRAGRDPLRLVARSLPGLDAGANPWTITSMGVDRLGLVADDETWIGIAPSTIVGRSPSAPEGSPHRLGALTDLSRTMSKSHLLLEVADDSLFATDLGSTNGSRAIDQAGRSRTLATGVRTRIAIDDMLELGDRRFRIATGRGGSS